MDVVRDIHVRVTGVVVILVSNAAISHRILPTMAA